MRVTTVIRYSEIHAATRHLGETDQCPYCRNSGWITCPDHLAPGNYYIAGPNSYRFCLTCDSAEEVAPKTGCPCGDE